MSTLHRTPRAPLLQQFFVDRLQRQRQASACAIGAYRDAFRLFLAFAETKLRKRPADLAFLYHLEQRRRNSVHTRNARFAALRSLS